jgi:hypothetical protein
MSRAGATGFEPAIFGLTGRHVNRYTTPPVASPTIPELLRFVKSSFGICFGRVGSTGYIGTSKQTMLT